MRTTLRREHIVPLAQRRPQPESFCSDHHTFNEPCLSRSLAARCESQASPALERLAYLCWWCGRRQKLCFARWSEQTSAIRDGPCAMNQSVCSDRMGRSTPHMPRPESVPGWLIDHAQRYRAVRSAIGLGGHQHPIVRLSSQGLRLLTIRGSEARLVKLARGAVGHSAVPAPRGEGRAIQQCRLQELQRRAPIDGKPRRIGHRCGDDARLTHHVTRRRGRPAQILLQAVPVPSTSTVPIHP